MRTSAKLTLTALAASLLLASAVSTSSARNLSISNQAIRATWTSLEFAAVGVILRCQVTLEGSFHLRTITKVARTLVGAITRARFKQETCTNGIVAAFNGTERYNGVTPTNSLPWHLTYQSFVGTLPNIQVIVLLLSRFRLGTRDNSGFCTGQYGTATDNVSLNANREAGGGITSIEPREPTALINLVRFDGGVVCPSPVEFQGRGSFMLLGNTTRITVTLI